MSLILDASATLAWIYSEETTDPIRRLFAQVEELGAWAPSLWKLEIANVLQMGMRRGRYKADFLDATLLDLSRLAIRIDPDCERFTWSTTLNLASLYGLTLYDATYLELAKRRGLPLATLDRELRAAAVLEGVALLGA